MFPPKQKPSKPLAIFGGLPACPEKLYVGRPNLGDKAALFARLRDVIESGWLTNNGSYLREFEQRVAEITNVAHCVAVCNATVGLELVARALNLRGEVIVPAFTFAATPHALQWQGITPVFCDVDPHTHALDPQAVERLITPRTTGILGVHLWGQACDTESLATIARRYRLQLFFDAAHAFGCSRGGRKLGGFGAAEVFSFHATKFCNSFEGGAITTNNAELAERLRALRNFGIAQDDWVCEVGTNGKLTEVAAAMGVTSLESLNEFIAINRSNYLVYQRNLAQVAGVKLFEYDLAESNNFQYIVVEVNERAAGLKRDELLLVLQAEGVMAKRYFYPGCHRMTPYRRAAQPSLPVTERLAETTLALPTGTRVTPQQAQLICTLIATAVQQATDVRRALAASASPAVPCFPAQWDLGFERWAQTWRVAQTTSNNGSTVGT